MWFFDGSLRDVEYRFILQQVSRRISPVIDRYGQDACRGYLEGVVENPISLKLLDVRRIGSWDWETDGLSTTIGSIYSETANRTDLGSTEEVEVHLAVPGDDSVRWLTDCGEPLP